MDNASDPVPKGTKAPRSQVAAHAGITFAGLMSANVFGYIFYTLVSRTLGVEAYGTFSSLMAVILILQAPATIVQMVVAKLASDISLEPARLAGLIGAVDRATFAVAGAGAGALIALSVPLAAFLRISDPWLVTLAGCALFGAIALPFMRGVLQGTSAFTAFAISNVVESLGRAVLAPALGLAAGVRGAIAGTALGFAIGAAYTFRTAVPRSRGEAVPFSLRGAARTSLGVVLAVFAISVLTFYDVILGKRYLDAHTIGLYGAAALASRALYAVVAFVPIVLLPQAAGRMVRGERTRWLYLQALGAAAAICVVAVTFYVFAPRFVITLIAGRPFADGARLLPTYGFAIAMLSLANITATYNLARGRLRFVVPLLAVVAAEVLAVVMRHRTAFDLLQTIAIGHTLAFLATTVSLGGARGTGVREGPAAAG